jgi:separase|tara:strand:- start:185 stop:607 length:423 start_codon:yes stop_codon:yes gene_type:complete
MSTCAVYLFCGHNHGATYLESVVESNFMSAMLLMGCSSGALSNEGDSVSRGVAIELLARGVPTVVAMLWDVTDRDVDCVTLELVQLLAKNPTCPIPDQLCTAKKAARLLALNGAATVCYGLPVSLAEIESSRRIIQTWQV